MLDPGEGHGGPDSPSFLDQTEWSQEGRDNFFWDLVPPYLSVWMNGAHPYLKVSIRHCIVTERWPLEADLRREHESRIYWKLPTKRFSLTLDYESRLINCDGYSQ